MAIVLYVLLPLVAPTKEVLYFVYVMFGSLADGQLTYCVLLRELLRECLSLAGKTHTFV